MQALKHSLWAEVFQVLTELNYWVGELSQCPGFLILQFAADGQNWNSKQMSPKKAQSIIPQWVTPDGFHFCVQNENSNWHSSDSALVI